jgi:cob(I)alamin adenosyltransferase
MVRVGQRKLIDGSCWVKETSFQKFSKHKLSDLFFVVVKTGNTKKGVKENIEKLSEKEHQQKNT